MLLECMLYKERDELLEQYSTYSKSAWLSYEMSELSDDMGILLDELVDQRILSRHKISSFNLSDKGRLLHRNIIRWKQENESDEISKTIEKFLIYLLSQDWRTKFRPRDVAAKIHTDSELLNSAILDLKTTFPQHIELITTDIIGRPTPRINQFEFKRAINIYARHIKGGMCWTELHDTIIEQIHPSHVEQYMSGDQYNITGNNLTNSQVSAGVNHSNTMNVNAEEPLKNDVERYFNLIKQLMLEIQSISKENLDHELSNQDLLINLYKEITNLDETIKEAIIDEKIKLSDLVDMIEPMWEKEMKELTKSQWVKLSEKIGNAIFSKVVGKIVP